MYPVQFEQKYKELEKNGLLIGDQIEVEFEIGNYYKKYDEPIKSTDGSQDVTMQCTPFVRFKNAEFGPLIASFVNDVDFKLCNCPNPNCENTISRRPKCNNCENCLKKNNGEYVEPDYEVSAKLNCWSKMTGIPINISFVHALSTKPEKKCGCCDKLQRSSFMQYASKIICEWELPEKAETIKVLFNKVKVVTHMEK